MRILAIRGANLASLAAPFEIDLTVEPIAGAGLFAITGETGAGKSTILDALCLALYGEYPRIAEARREMAPDPSGEEISVHDGRAILRRGAGSGYAEVDFIGRDDEAYRVRWEVNRARGRANGRLQGEQRSLVRIADGGGVATGKNPVRDAVEVLTDLTFAQFRRTVLLAQGEFDAFLIAAESERAELLEKITGTEIYARISSGVHQGTEARRRTFDDLERRRNEVGLLDAAARLALTTEQQEHTTGIALKTALREEKAHKIAHCKRVAGTHADLAEAQARAAAAYTARQDSEVDYAALAEFNIVEPLRPLSAALHGELETLVQYQGRLEGLNIARTQAVANDAAAAALLAEAEVADNAVESVFKTFGPVWSAAEKLDVELSTAITECESSSQKLRESEAATETRAANLAILDADYQRARISHQDAVATLSDKSPHALIADRCEDAIALIRKRVELRSNRAAVHQDAVDTRETLGRLEREIVDLTSALASDRASSNEYTGTIGRLLGTLEALDEQVIATRDIHFGSILDVMRDVASECDSYQSSATALAFAGEEHGAAQEAIAAAAASLADADAELAQVRAVRAEIAPLADLAAEAGSPEALHLRTSLITGEACPVCGSKTHPHVENPSALNDFISKLRDRRKELDATIDIIGHRLETIVRERVAAEVRLSEAAHKMDMTRHHLASAIDAYAGIRPQLVDLCERAGLPAQVPAALDTPSVGLLEVLGAEVRVLKQSLSEPLAQAQRLRTEVEQLRENLGICAQAIERTRQNLENRRADLHAAQLKIQEYTVRDADLGERLASIERELMSFLTANASTLTDLDTDPEEIVRQFTDVSATVLGLRDQVRDLDLSLQKLKPECAAAAASLAHARTQVEENGALAAQRQAAVDGKTLARAALLDGEATGVHRTRINEARKQARDALTVARDTKATAGASLQGAIARCEEAIAAASAAETRHRTAETAFNDGCLGIDWLPTRVAAKLAEDPGVYAALNTKIQNLEQTVRDATVALATREDDLRRALEGFDAASDMAVLEAESETLATEIAALLQRSGALSEALARDDEAGRVAAALSAGVDAARNELEVWQAVDNAIGSANGDRFRRFVQGITLDHLIHLANENLNALRPRYKLSRGSISDLALHIIDQDMADAVRASRSLSGGERFLVSLALALALSGLEGRSSFVDTLFIDEGFGALDPETLDIAVDALESLQGRGQKVGVITHVAAMIDRIAVQVRVEKRGPGRSELLISDGATFLQRGDITAINSVLVG